MRYFILMVILADSIDCRSTLLPDMRAKIEITATTTSTKTSTYEPQVICNQNKFVVVKNNAYLVKDFALSSTFNFSCYLEFIPIEIQVQHEGVSNLLTMFMGPSGCELHPAQKVSEYCRKIRRYVFFLFI
jgi:hypothetical protein